MLEECYYFYRADQKCLLAMDPLSDGWCGFIGFPKEHPMYGCHFKKVNNIAIYKVSINELIDSISDIRINLWYMGFSHHPYSREKTLESLKAVADGIKENGYD